MGLGMGAERVEETMGAGLDILIAAAFAIYLCKKLGEVYDKKKDSKAVTNPCKPNN